LESVALLNSNVLVLNRSWMAIHIANVRRAMGLVYQGMAKVVSPDDFATYDFEDWKELSQAAESNYICTVNFKIKVPEIIVLSFFNGMFRQEVRFSRHNIFERDKNRCQYCGRKFGKTDLTIDHVIPRSKGGKDTWQNMVLACVPCNIRKGNRTPHEADMGLIRTPSKPAWVPFLGAKLGAVGRESWQKFVDMAYWNVELGEDA